MWEQKCAMSVLLTKSGSRKFKIVSGEGKATKVKATHLVLIFNVVRYFSFFLSFFHILSKKKQPYDKCISRI